MKPLKLVAIIAAILLPGILLTLFIYNETARIRMLEMEQRMVSLNRQDSNEEYITLVMKYEQAQKMYEKELVEDDLAEEELTLLYLYNRDFFKQEDDVSPGTRLVLGMVNAFRFMLRKEPIRIGRDDFYNYYIDMAYYYERNKKYRLALELYGQAAAFEEGYTFNKGVILLHQGFCSSLLGDDATARERYQAVIDHYENDKIAITAFILLQYLDYFNSERTVVRKKRDSIEKSKDLYHLVAYRESLEILSSLEKSARDGDKATIRYYMARCSEEMGETVDALEQYQALIIDDPRTRYARLSNRRLFLVSKNEESDQLRELSLANNLLIGDQDFDRFTAEADRMALDAVDPENYAASPETESINNEFINRRNDFSRFATRYRAEVDKLATRDDDRPRTTTTTIPKEKTARRNEFVHSYDAAGLLTRSDYYNADGELEYYNLYEYAADGQVVKMSQYDPADRLVKYYTYDYDADGNPSVIKEYDAKGRLIEK
jgi:hypothetical protein